MQFKLQKIGKYIPYVCFLCLCGLFFWMMVSGFKRHEKKLAQKQITLLQESKERMPHILDEQWKTCRRPPWKGEDRVPIIGGGWVDIKKIPYDFIDMREDDDGICRAMGIVESFFYWDGVDIIPLHDVFSGNQLGTFGSGRNTHIPMYPAESWKMFSIKVTFRNQREAAECKGKGIDYIHNIQWGCLKKCGKEGEPYVIKQGECVINWEKSMDKISPSRKIKSAIYPGLEMQLDKEVPPYFITDGIRFRVLDWPYESKTPVISINKRGLRHDYIAYLPKDQLKSFDFGRVYFDLIEATSISKNFYFYGGVAQPRSSNMFLYEIPFFLRKLHDYLSTIVIKEFEL